MSHVDYKKWKYRSVDFKKVLCRPVDFKKVPCRPVDFKKVPCRPVDFKKVPCRLSLMPKKGCVAMSILGVYTPHSVIRPLGLWYNRSRALLRSPSS